MLTTVQFLTSYRNASRITDDGFDLQVVVKPLYIIYIYVERESSTNIRVMPEYAEWSSFIPL